MKTQNEWNNDLLSSARDGDLFKLQKCIESANISTMDRKGRNALTLATIFNNTNCIDFLIKSGADDIMDVDVLYSTTLQRMAFREEFHTTQAKINIHQRIITKEKDTILSKKNNLKRIKDTLKKTKPVTLKRRPRPAN